MAGVIITMKNGEEEAAKEAFYLQLIILIMRYYSTISRREEKNQKSRFVHKSAFHQTKMDRTARMLSVFSLIRSDIPRSVTEDKNRRKTYAFCVQLIRCNDDTRGGVTHKERIERRSSFPKRCERKLRISL